MKFVTGGGLRIDYTITHDGRRDDLNPATHFARINHPLPPELADYVDSTPGRMIPMNSRRWASGPMIGRLFMMGERPFILPVTGCAAISLSHPCCAKKEWLKSPSIPANAI